MYVCTHTCTSIVIHLSLYIYIYIYMYIYIYIYIYVYVSLRTPAARAGRALLPAPPGIRLLVHTCADHFSEAQINENLNKPIDNQKPRLTSGLYAVYMRGESRSSSLVADQCTDVASKFWTLATGPVPRLSLRARGLRSSSLLRFVDSKLPGNSLGTWEFHPLTLRFCLSQTL